METKKIYRTKMAISTWSAGIAAVATFIIAITAMFSGGRDIFQGKTSLSKKMFEDLVIRISVLESKVGSISSTIEDSNDVKIGALAKEIVDARSEVRALKNIILQDPEATLTLPLLKKDIDQLKDSYRSIRNDMNNMAGLSKWFIGSLITISVGLISLIIAVILKGK